MIGRVQVRVASNGPPVTAPIEAQIRQRVTELEKHVNNLPGCTRCLRHLRFLVIAKAGRIRIHLDMRGDELTIDKHNTANLSRAIDDAFTAARIQLDEYVAKLREEAKIQGRSPDVRVSTIFHDSYGVLETPDGREVNFSFCCGPLNAHSSRREAC